MSPAAAAIAAHLRPALFISQCGRVACGAHGGRYLAAAVAARPRARSHTTPLDHWVRVPAGAGATCETCEATK